ncbi:SET domain-containing protein [Parathielavia appendiculata]|uniref:SET domain-containing protein n=1 Tax=Parathielavia appendiculata TaxID=2587402 RepID=A0AAN6U161_9PEZI|nr:SET domain-containing protein [Parathielavia appendiculata]
MAVPTTYRHLGRKQSLNSGLLALLILCIALQGCPALSHSHRPDWAACSWNIHNEILTRQSGQGTCPLASDWSPWSQKPFCLESSKEDDTAQQDCVFTMSAFRGNQGLSLITTADLAASVVESLDDSRVPPVLRRQLANSGQQQPGERSAYEIRNVPGRGKGVVAKRRFSKHQIIMVDFPVLIIRLDFVNNDRYTQRQKRRLMETSVRQLPTEQRRAIMGLARSSGGEPILEALRTNGFGIEIEAVQHLALFLNGSRVNHNCRPNSFWRFTNSNMAMEVVALRDVSVGEEITHSYAPLGHTYEERKRALQAWGFRCNCALCSTRTVERDLSDSRRERLREVHLTLGQAERLGSQRVAELVREAMSLIEQEELDPQLVEYYQQFAKAYLDTNHLERARLAIAEADRLWRLYGGEEHENVDGIRELWQALAEAEQDAHEE